MTRRLLAIASSGGHWQQLMRMRPAFAGTEVTYATTLAGLPEAFEAAFREARLIVGHAGIGTVLSAQRFRKPLILLPRRTALGEHRNDHQMATARQLDGRQGLTIAWEADALAALVAETGQPPMGGADAAPALADFLTRLSRIIAQ